MGLDFKAPRQTDREQWRKVELLFAHGIGYSSCGCDGPGFRPARLRDVPKFLEERATRAAQAKRLQRISERAAELKTRRKRNHVRNEDKRLRSLNP